MVSKKKAFLKIFIFLILVSISSTCSAKYADLAGAWYPDSPEKLKSDIEKYLDKADVGDVNGEVIGAIVPHAGLRFSGEVAAYSYKAIMEKSPDTIILIGFTHRNYFPGKISILTDDYYQTPLGKAPINKELTQKFLEADSGIESIPEAFAEENSVELQIPFIQVAFGDAKLVVMAMADQRIENINRLSDALYSVLKNEKNFAIIASADMSHYLDYGAANKKDAETVKLIEEFDSEALYLDSLKNNQDLMCGPGPVCAVIAASKKLGANETKILKYANSGDTFGGKDRVVGYLSAAFIKSSRSGFLGSESATKKEGDMFNEEQRSELLQIARNTIGHYLKTGKRLEVDTSDDALKQDMGAFVTLHKEGQLRGCIGNMQAQGPLYLAVRDMAIAAAVEDPRFRPLTSDELDEVDIEISALSPMEKIDDYKIIEAGKHGVMVRMGLRGGVYLPQVATENGWDREEFMNSLCAQKSGIPMDAWKTGQADLYIFTAEVFGEREETNE